MDTDEDDDRRLRPTTAAATAAAAAAMELGLCLSLGVLLTMGAPRTPKPLSTAINVTHGALKSAMALRHIPTSPESLFLASKALARGYKISKDLNLRRPRSLSSLYKRLRPCFASIDLLRYASAARSPLSDGFALLAHGYKLSKSLVRVLEGFAGVEVDKAIRSGFDAVGLMMKAVSVVREVGRVVANGRGSRRCSFGLDGLSSKCGVCVRFVGERSDLAARGGGGGGGGDRGWGGEGEVEMEEMDWLGGLLCLSVPLDDRLVRLWCVV